MRVTLSLIFVNKKSDKYIKNHSSYSNFTFFVI